jgi:predicted TIM-barrel fold metal-dependent hydrolase
MIIDAHTHRYPEEVINDPTRFAKRTGEKMWLNMVSPKDRPSLQGWANREEMLASMDAAGVRQSVLLGWYWENQKTCLEANQWHRQWMKQDKERFIGFLSLHPKIPQLLDYLKRAREDGFRGIGESHPWAQGFSMQDKEWIKAMEFACESGWPVNFHVTDPEGKDYPGKTLTPIEDFLWLANELPDLKIILAHAGALYPLKNSIPSNFYIDLAACPLIYPTSIFKELIEHVGSEKILWGTDYPLRIYPATQKNPDFKTFLDTFIDSVDVTENELRAMLGGNFANLLG